MSATNDLSILQVCRGRHWSGGENIVLALATGLRRRGVDASVLTFGAGPLARELEDAGVPIEALGHRSRVDPRGVLRLWRLLRAQRPDVVHSHGTSARVIADPLARLAGVPVVMTTIHRIPGPGRQVTHQPLDELYQRLETFIGRWATDLSVCYAEPARREAIVVRGVPEDRAVVVHSGIDLDRFASVTPDSARREARTGWRARLGVPGDAFVVGAIGRLIEAKGHEHLIAALARIRAARPDAVVVIVGEGPLAGRLRQQVRTLGLESVVFLPGALRGSPELYAAFDVFVYPSILGVFGLVVLEAMACGVPVVASHLPGSEVLLTDGLTALVVPPGNPAAIAAAALRLGADPGLADRLSTRARAQIRQRFSADAMVDRYLALYRALLAREPVAAAIRASRP